jgi:hypothetical protein
MNEIRRIRGICFMNGTTFSKWLTSKGFNPPTAFNALHGRRKGPTATRILEEVHAAFLP